MPRLTETFARKTPHPTDVTEKYWDTEVRGLVLFVGKRSKIWYFQKDVGGQTRRVLIGRYPIISAEAARQSGMALALDMARGVGKSVQSGAPTLAVALEAYVARPKLRSDVHKHGLRLQFARHLKDWLRLPFTEITKATVVQRHRDMSNIPPVPTMRCDSFARSGTTRGERSICPNVQPSRSSGMARSRAGS